jgi:ATP-dependent Clp protease protease subunit
LLNNFTKLLTHMIVPTVLDSTTRGAYDIYSLLLKERIVFLGTAIEENIANLVVAQLLYLDSESHAPIMLYINSPGGVVYSGFAIYDTMRKLKSPVSTVAVGFCGSMATVLLTAGAKWAALCTATCDRAHASYGRRRQRVYRGCSHCL